MSICPECKAKLSPLAEACRCGWEKSSGPVTYSCAHTTCQKKAIARIETQTGWANVCIGHYEKYYLQKAQQKCADMGLLTAEMCREWIRKNGIKVKRFST